MKNNRKTNSRKNLGLRLLGGAICCVVVLEGNMSAVAAKDVFNRKMTDTAVNAVAKNANSPKTGSGQDTAKQTQIPEYKTNIYEQKFISLDLDAKWNDVIGMQKKDGRVYFVVETREWDGKKVNDSDASDQTTDSKEKPKVTAKYYLFSMNEDGEDLQKVELDLVSTNTETWKKVEGNSWFCFVQDEVCIFDEVSGQICRFKMDGTLLQTIEMEQDVIVRNLYEVNNELYILMEKSLPTYRNAGVLHVNSNGNLEGWNPIRNNENESKYIHVSNFVDGKLYISCGMDKEHGYGYTFGEFDPISGDLIKSYELDNNYLDSFYAAEDGRLYRFQCDMFAYDLKKRTEEKVINAIPSGIDFLNGNVNCNHFMMIGEKKYLYVKTGENESVISILKYIPSEKIKDKKMITVCQATRVTDHYWYEDYKELIDYNKTNDDYVAVLYNGQHNWEDALQNGEIDVLEYSRSWDEEYYVERKLDQLGRDGVLANVDLLIAKDPELSKKEYMENIWDEFRVDANLYQVISGFDVESYVAKKTLVDQNSNMTLPDLYNLAKQRGLVLDDSLIIPSNLLSYEILYHREDYIDDEKGSCNFMTKEFLDLLEYSEVYYMDDMRWEAQKNFKKNTENKEIPINETKDKEIKDKEIKDKESLLICFQGLGAHEDEKKKFKDKIGNEDISFIGYPGMKGTEFIFNEYGARYAIASNSHDLEAAWHYTRRFLTPEYAPADRFSVVKEITEKQAEIGTPEQNKALFDYLCSVNKRGINDAIFKEFNEGHLNFENARTAMEKAEAIQDEVTKLLQRKGKE